MLITAGVFFVILSILILIHEVGHFLSAKKLGIKVEEFGFGLPPRIYGKKIGETIYSLNALPIGGFVKLFGEEWGEDEKNKKKLGKRLEKRAFYARSVWQKSLVLLSGVGMNFLLAVIIISYLFNLGVMVPVDRLHIEKVLPGSPAAAVGLQEKDLIKKMIIPKMNQEKKVIDFNIVEIKEGNTLIKTTKEHLGEQIILIIERNGQELSVNIIPRKDYPSDEGPMGIVISNYEEKRYPFWQAPILGIKESIIMSYELAKGIAKTIWKLVTFQPVAKDVAGPIGIAQMTGQAVQTGYMAVLQLLGLLSLNLAIVNALPFPALDGGRLVFVIIEGITGKKIRTHWERYIHQAGMVVLLALMLLVTLNDLLRIFSK